MNLFMVFLMVKNKALGLWRKMILQHGKLDFISVNLGTNDGGAFYFLHGRMKSRGNLPTAIEGRWFLR